jgi:hypothetical protein
VGTGLAAFESKPLELIATAHVEDEEFGATLQPFEQVARSPDFIVHSFCHCGLPHRHTVGKSLITVITGQLPIAPRTYPDPRWTTLRWSLISGLGFLMRRHVSLAQPMNK